MTTPEMRSAIVRHAKVNHLAGLQEAITQARHFLSYCEESCTGDLATTLLMHKAAAFVDNLETRAALLEKQIGG